MNPAKTPCDGCLKNKATKKNQQQQWTVTDSEEDEDESVKIARREALTQILRDELATPYLTCQCCNSVTFISVNRVRTRLNRDKALGEYEQLPVCSGCGTTKYLRAGVVSFQEKIAEEKQRIREFEKRRVPATHLIIRIARGFLGRLAYRRRRREHELHLLRIRVAATKIQSRVRGMQARKRAIYERCLCIIKTMHSSVLQFALAARPDRPPVFWYDSPGELQILFWNYREFVRRSGSKPPLFKVESNILEITRRMLLREYELVCRIQSRWRGLTTRLVFVEFKRQRGWLKGLLQSPAIKIQRLYRAHHARKTCRVLRAVRKYPDHLAAYREERAAEAKQDAAKAFRKRLLAKYRLAYQVNKTCRMAALESKPEQEEEEDQAANTSQHVQHSLAGGSHVGVETSPPQRNQHPNARRLAQIKSVVDAKRARGPRLRLFNAQAFAASREESDP